MQPWKILGIPADSDRSAIRRAYAAKLRVTNPEDDADGFKRLRAAYEQALLWCDRRLAWERDDEDEADVELDEESGDCRDDIDQMSASPYPPLRLHDPKLPGDRPIGDPEVEAILAEREAELETLRSAMRALEQGLRGAWQPDIVHLEAGLRSALAADILNEIEIRGEFEIWLADLLAETIPRSDALLAQALRAMGWRDDGRGGNAYYSVVRLRDRIEELRLIERFGRHESPMHRPWRLLTEPPAPPLLWRLQAARPGLATKVGTLLDEVAASSPGLCLSFNAASVARWREYLEKPHLTIGHLLLAPLAWAALYFVMRQFSGLSGSELTGIEIFGGVFGLVAPAIGFQLTKDPAAKTGWRRDGWFILYWVTLLVTLLLPISYWAAAAVLALGWTSAAWMSVTGKRSSSLVAALGSSALGLTAYGLAGYDAIGHMAPAGAAIAGMLAALVGGTFIGRSDHITQLLTHIAGARPIAKAWAALAAILILVATVAWARRVYFGEDYGAVFVAAAVAVAAILPLIAVLANRNIWWSKALHLLLFAGFAFAASPLWPDANPTVKERLARMEQRQPGFAKIRTGNPALYAKLREIVQRRHAGILTDASESAAIETLINAELHTKQLKSSTPLVVESIRIALAETEALRKISPRACVQAKGVERSKLLPTTLVQRDEAHDFDILAGSDIGPAEAAKGKAISDAAIGAEMTRSIGLSAEALSEAIAGKAGEAAQCDARIALFAALLRQDPEDLAFTMREQLKRDQRKPPKTK